VDADTGAVLDSLNARTLLPPASISKVMVALAAVRALPPGAKVTASARAAGAPAHVIGMAAGQVWRLDDALHALLMSSANDAAVALAERVSGSVDKFQATAGALAAQLGMADRPVFRDPAGLDDSTSVGGGNLASARDLAIAGRALLASPTLSAIVGQRAYSFTGPDGAAHKLVNHNKLLSRYPGAVGLKTGYTVKAGGTLMAAARRNGRTMLTVVLGSPDIYGPTTALLDKGFATPVRAEPTAGRLPPVVTGRPAARPKPVRKATPRPVVPPRRVNLRGVASVPPAPPLPVLTVGAVSAAVFLRRRAVLHRRRARVPSRRSII
jgi:D-alanyl-D-alanine carboxypeptidase (penicillin-binding protein 5/6)